MADISAQPIPDFGQLLSSYGQGQANIGLTQAQIPQAQAATGLAKAQTGLIGQQAQKTALEVQMIKQAMLEANSQPQDNSQNDQSGIDPTETGIASYLNKKLFVDPAGDPALYRKATLMGAAGMSSAATAYEKLNALQVASRTAKSQNMANDIWQTSSSLVNGADKDGNIEHPLQKLLSLNEGSTLKNIGKAIAMDSSKSPEEKDQAAEAAIKAAAKYSHQYTGRETEMVGDNPVDKLTKLPVFAPRAAPTNAQQLEAAKFNATPQTATTDNRTSTVYPHVQLGQDGKPVVKTPGAGTGSAPRKLDINDPTDLVEGLKRAGFSDQEANFVKDQPKGMAAIKPNQQFNEQDKIYLAQRQKLAQENNIEVARAQDSLTHIKQIQGLMSTPGLTFGPGSREYAQMQTFFNQWLGTSAGQAGAYQILSKVLNASEMNDLLNEFHKEGAQVRLGAYESRLIMEKLAANPNLTKEAVDQMLKWQESSTQYEQNKARVAAAVIATGKSVENFDANYGTKFPKQDLVETSANDIIQRQHGKSFNFEATKGKTYTTAEVQQAALKTGIPLLMFERQLKTAGATIK